MFVGLGGGGVGFRVGAKRVNPATYVADKMRFTGYLGEGSRRLHTSFELSLINGPHRHGMLLEHQYLAAMKRIAT